MAYGSRTLKEFCAERTDRSGSDDAPEEQAAYYPNIVETVTIDGTGRADRLLIKRSTGTRTFSKAAELDEYAAKTG
jgi:hypothetical protein